MVWLWTFGRHPKGPLKPQLSGYTGCWLEKKHADAQITPGRHLHRGAVPGPASAGRRAAQKRGTSGSHGGFDNSMILPQVHLGWSHRPARGAVCNTPLCRPAPLAPGEHSSPFLQGLPRGRAGLYLKPAPLRVQGRTAHCHLVSEPSPCSPGRRAKGLGCG